MTIERIAILGTGLIGASVGLALRSHGFEGEITGWDPDPKQSAIALEKSAIHRIADNPLIAAEQNEVILLCGPVLTILEWLDLLGSMLQPEQLVTDVGSVKQALCEHAASRFNGPDQPGFLPGHPMAGKEIGGAASADAELFNNAVWLFTEPVSAASMHPAVRILADKWRGWIAKFGCRVIDMDPARHDVLCAWISHLPQFVSTAMSALLEEQFAANDDLLPIGGRALREMTRLGASPFSMWRDIAHTNSGAIANSLLALEQHLAHIRENLKTPELREEFEQANRFRLVTNPRKA